MRFRLGNLDPQPGSDCYGIHALDDPIVGEGLTSALESMLQVRMSRTHARQESEDGTGRDDRMPLARRLPDLLEMLRDQDGDRRLASDVHETLCAIRRRGQEIRLLACEHESGPGGFLSIAATCPSLSASVRPDDEHWAGVAVLREANAEPRVWPRLFRVVCANGSLVVSGAGDEVVGAEHVGNAVTESLSRHRFESAIEMLREAASTEVEDFADLRDEFCRLCLNVQPEEDLRLMSRLNAIMSRSTPSEDSTLYGVMNAITAQAREAADFRERLELEELAGRLARLRRPVPTRTGRMMAVLVGSD